jgi:hypothetical protein
MTQLSKARDNYDQFAYARDHGHLDFVAKAEMCDLYFEGQQWDSKVVARLNRLGKPIITINKVLSTCATVFGEQLQNRADVSFRPSRGGSSEIAQVLDKLWLHIAHSQRLDWLESEVAADGFIRGRGFFDCRIGFDDQMMGEVRIKQLNSKNVLIDPDAETYDPDEWQEVFITKWLSADDVENIYGKRYAKELRQRPNTAFTHTYDSVDWIPDSFGGDNRPWGAEDTEDSLRRRIYRVIERQHRELRYTEWFIDPVTGDMREVPEIWDRNRVAHVAQRFGYAIIKRKTSRIRWVVSLDDILLHDEVSPYKHFTPVPYFPYFRHGKTIGIVENLLSPQDLLNKSISQELHIINTTANSGWILKSGALANMTVEQLEDRSGEDGLILEAHTSPNDIIKIQPNQVPSGIDRLSFKADESLKEVSMVSDSMRGFDRADVAAKAIQAKQMRGSIAMAKPFDNLAYTRQLLARNVLDLVQTFYDEPRIINVTGRNLTDQSEPLEINQQTPEGEIVNDLTIGEYAVVVTTVPARQDYEQSQFAEALEMRQLGIAIPDDVLIEHSHLGRKGEIAARMKAMAGESEPSQAQQQLQQLEMQLKQLEAEEKQADVQVKMSNAALNSARAEKEQLESQGGENQAEMLKMAIQREEMMAKMKLEQEKMAQEIELKKAELEAEIELKWAEFRAEMEIEKQKAQIEQQLQQQKMAFEGEKLNMQREVNMAKLDTEVEKADMQRQAMQEKAMFDREKTGMEMQMKREESEANRAMQADQMEHKKQMDKESTDINRRKVEGELKVREKAASAKPSGAKKK